MFLCTVCSKQFVKTSNGCRQSPVNKSKVLEEWLHGISRTKISKDNGIGEWTVTDIHKQSRNNGITDFESARKIAIMLKEEVLM
jgi:hypothetical protein